jgi:AcrR family transcriptional regulator
VLPARLCWPDRKTHGSFPDWIRIMNSQAGATVKYRTPLRQAQRELTRGRIRDAARELFYEHHYDTTTMDEIALAAGLRRSTVYLHFRDKAEILADIIADYTPRARALLATLPGPAPTLRQVQRWMREVVKFVAEERIPLSIIQELRRMNRANAQALSSLTGELLSGLGANNPPFALAARDTAAPARRARALMLLQELTYACEMYLDDAEGEACSKALLTVAAEDFHSFLSRGEA